MLYEGLVDEGFAVVKGARDRYDGIPRTPIQRSPWCEVECGGHYARAMSSWSLLLAMSGFHYDGLTQTLRFQPLEQSADFKSFFTGPEGWGSLSRNAHGHSHEIKVVAGHVAITHLQIAAASTATKARVMLGQNAVTVRLTHSADGALITFTQPLLVTQERGLTVHIS